MSYDYLGGRILSYCFITLRIGQFCQATEEYDLELFGSFGGITSIIPF